MATSHAPRGRASPDGLDGEEERRRALPLTPEHLARLLELSRALAGACEHGEIAALAAERARDLTGAAATTVSGQRHGGALVVLAEAPGAAAAPDRRAPVVRRGAPEHGVLRSGTPLWLGTRAEAAEHCPGAALEALGGGPEGASWALLPLVADGETSGVLTLVFDEARSFDDPARAFLGEVAAVCANALARGTLFTRERARADASEEARAACEVRQRRSDDRFAERTRLYERERFARARAEAETVVAVHAADDLERVHPLTAALFAANAAQDVVAALEEHGRPAFGALDLGLTRRAAGGAVPAEGEAGGAEAEVLRGGLPLWLDAEELARRFPETSAALLARGGGSWLGVPVPGEDGLDAVLSVSFPRARAFTPGDRARLTLLASECASVLSRCATRDASASAQAARDAAAASAPGAVVVQYQEVGVDGPVSRVLGVFSSEVSARAALRALDGARSLVVHASITTWSVDVPGAPTSVVEIDLSQ